MCFGKKKKVLWHCVRSFVHMSQLTPLAGSVYENFELCRSINPSAPGCNNLRRKAPVIFTVVENLFRANILLEFTTKLNLCLVESHHLLQRFFWIHWRTKMFGCSLCLRAICKNTFLFPYKNLHFFSTNKSFHSGHSPYSFPKCNFTLLT